MPVARLARCAAASMPRASPDTMTKPASPSSRASRSANLHAGGRGIARADDRHHGRGERRELAAHRDQRRRIVDHAQPRRIVRLAQRDEGDAELGAAAISRSASSRGQMRRRLWRPPRRASSGSASSAARAPP